MDSVSALVAVAPPKLARWVLAHRDKVERALAKAPRELTHYRSIAERMLNAWIEDVGISEVNEDNLDDAVDAAVHEYADYFERLPYWEPLARLLTRQDLERRIAPKNVVSIWTNASPEYDHKYTRRTGKVYEFGRGGRPVNLYQVLIPVEYERAQVGRYLSGFNNLAFDEERLAKEQEYDSKADERAKLRTENDAYDKAREIYKKATLENDSARRLAMYDEGIRTLEGVPGHGAMELRELMQLAQRKARAAKAEQERAEQEKRDFHRSPKVVAWTTAIQDAFIAAQASSVTSQGPDKVSLLLPTNGPKDVQLRDEFIRLLGPTWKFEYKGRDQYTVTAPYVFLEPMIKAALEALVSESAPMPLVPPRKAPPKTGQWCFGWGGEVWFLLPNGQGYLRYPPGTPLRGGQVRPPRLGPVQDVEAPADAARLLPLVADASGDPTNRYGLTTPFWDGEWLAASNGNQLNSVRVSEAHTSRRVLPVPLDRGAKLIRKADAYWVVTPSMLYTTGPYPDWHQVIPTNWHVELQISPAEARTLLSAVKKIKSGDYWVQFGPSTVDIAARVGQERVTLMPADGLGQRYSFIPELVEIGLAPFVKEKLGVLVRFTRQEFAPVLLTGGDLRNVIMPARTE